MRSSYSLLVLASVLLIGVSWAEETGASTPQQAIEDTGDQLDDLQLLEDELEQRLAKKILKDELIDQLLWDPQGYGYGRRERINIKINVDGKGRRGGYYGRRGGYGGYRGGYYYDQDPLLQRLPSKDQILCQKKRCACINKCDLLPTITRANVQKCFKKCFMMVPGSLGVCPP